MISLRDHIGIQIDSIDKKTKKLNSTDGGKALEKSVCMSYLVILCAEKFEKCTL